MNPLNRLRATLEALFRSLFPARKRKERRPATASPPASPASPASTARASADASRPPRDLPVVLTPSAAERVQGRLRSALQAAQSARLDLRERADERELALRAERLGMEAAAELAAPVAIADAGETAAERADSAESAAASAAFPASASTAALTAASAASAAFPAALTAASAAEASAPKIGKPASAADADGAILSWIRQETARMNRNNVTRTYAYHRIYTRHPELHWALLAHMVSRNTGWNMTDLKGDLVPRLLEWRRSEALYQMLERANALIFQDAYPQLLLYQEGKRRGRGLTFLLERLSVSSFMPPLWDDFAETGDPVPLAIGLIINEQNYIQGRVVENPFFLKEVLERPFFHMDSLLHVNQILLPYLAPDTGKIRLAGLTLEDFPDLHERIRFGRKLYALLFDVPAVREGCRRFADQVPHTGSRADYWPEVFAQHKETPPSRERTEASARAALHYSPTLAAAWPNRPVEPTVAADWFRDMSAFAHFSALKPPSSWMMDREHQLLLKAQEAAALAKSWIKPNTRP